MKNILIVEDDVDEGNAIIKKLIEYGYNPTHVEKGDSAFEIFKDAAFDLILLDVDLKQPIQDGFRVCEKIKKEKKKKNIPVIFITKYDDPDKIKKGFYSGGVDYVKKPWLPEELLARISAHIKEANKAEEFRELLKNIFPIHIADALMNNEKIPPKYYSFVSILFTDFYQFTKIVSGTLEETLIDKLNTYFTEFDEISQKNEVIKIKTIGDSYMCAAGIPKKNESNPIDAVLAGLQMQQFVKSQKGNWKMRIGIHTGKVIDGVIGVTGYAYDIWGEDVNTAKRIEEYGEIGKVNISQNTYAYIKHYFECTPMKEVEIKHGEKADMCFVKKIKPEYSDDGIIPNEKLKEIIRKKRDNR